MVLDVGLFPGATGLPAAEDDVRPLRPEAAEQENEGKMGSSIAGRIYNTWIQIKLSIESGTNLRKSYC